MSEPAVAGPARTARAATRDAARDATRKGRDAARDGSDAADAAPGRRERRKAETRRRLLAAARRLFVERGYHATRPQDVARLADLAAGTFYVHFQDKRDVFLAFTEEAAAELMERMRGPGAAAGRGRGLEARLDASLRALLAWSDENPGVLRVCFADEAVIATGPARGASLRDRLARTLAEGLRAGMREGEVRADYDPFVVAYGMVGLIQHAFTFGAHEGIDRDALLGNVIRFCSRALRPPEAPPA